MAVSGAPRIIGKGFGQRCAGQVTAVGLRDQRLGKELLRGVVAGDCYGSGISSSTLRSPSPPRASGRPSSPLNESGSLNDSSREIDDSRVTASDEEPRLSAEAGAPPHPGRPARRCSAAADPSCRACGGRRPSRARGATASRRAPPRAAGAHRIRTGLQHRYFAGYTHETTRRPVAGGLRCRRAPGAIMLSVPGGASRTGRPDGRRRSVERA